MPQRFLRPGIRNSERWNAVSADSANFYVRLLTLVDDFGQYDARLPLLWAECFTIWNDLHPERFIDLQQVAASCSELQQHKLVEFFRTESGKWFLQLTQWQERIRVGCKRKYPETADLQQVDIKLQQVAQKLLPSSSPPSSSPSPAPTPCGGVRDENFKIIKHKLSELYDSDRPLSNYEETMLNELSRRTNSADQLQTVLTYRDSLPPKERRFFPQSRRSFLEKWDETLDRAAITVKLNGHARTEDYEDPLTTKLRAKLKTNKS